jgi:hypothetical protein
VEDNGKGVLEYLSTVTELNDLSSQMQDPKLDQALELIIKLTIQPQVPINKIATTIVLARALSAEFKLKAKHYMIFDKTEAAKKNVYFSVAEELNGLADALKYLIRTV